MSEIWGDRLDLRRVLDRRLGELDEAANRLSSYSTASWIRLSDKRLIEELVERVRAHRVRLERSRADVEVRIDRTKILESYVPLFRGALRSGSLRSFEGVIGAIEDTDLLPKNDVDGMRSYLVKIREILRKMEERRGAESKVRRDFRLAVESFNPAAFLDCVEWCKSTGTDEIGLERLRVYLKRLRDGDLKWFSNDVQGAIKDALDQVTRGMEEDLKNLKSRLNKPLSSLVGEFEESKRNIDCDEIQKRILGDVDSLLREIDERGRRPWVDYVTRLVQCAREVASRAELNVKSPNFERDDDKLVGMWVQGSSKPTGDVELAMKAARRAELVAMRHVYGVAFEAQIEDLSVLQVRDPRRKEWKVGDIRVGKRIIDVKNSLRWPDLKKRFLPFTVKNKNRYDQKSQDVVLSAFVTERKDEVDDFVTLHWVGETSLETWEEIKRSAAVGLKLEGQVHTFLDRERLPPWLFDYPDADYDATRPPSRELSGIDLEDFGELPRESIPVNLRGFVCACTGIELPWTNATLQEASRVYRTFRSRRPTRAELYVYVIKRFVDCLLSADGHEFPSESLEQIFFPFLDQGKSRVAPFGVADPFECIFEAIDALRAVFDQCRKDGLVLRTIVLEASGILRAEVPQGPNGLKRVTLLAYCGGRVKSPGAKSRPCGKSPLIYGLFKSCPVCFKLICDECNFCTWQCSRVKPGEPEVPF